VKKHWAVNCNSLLNRIAVAYHVQEQLFFHSCEHVKFFAWATLLHNCDWFIKEHFTCHWLRFCRRLFAWKSDFPTFVFCWHLHSMGMLCHIQVISCDNGGKKPQMHQGINYRTTTELLGRASCLSFRSNSQYSHMKEASVASAAACFTVKGPIQFFGWPWWNQFLQMLQ
jgi:hypothetical protein